MKTRHDYPILLIALIAGLMGFTTGATWAQDTQRPTAKGYISGYPTAISPTKIRVEWNPGEDNVTLVRNLRYRVWYKKASSTEQFDTGPYLTGQTSYIVTGLEPNTEYLITVEVRDEANNFSNEPDRRVRTWPDTEAPKPKGYSGVYASDPNHIVVIWHPAEDNCTSPNELVYHVRYWTEGIPGKFESPALTEPRHTITVPTGRTTVEVTVKDKAGNEASYGTRTVTTWFPPTISPSELNVDANQHEYKVTISCEKAFRIIDYNYLGWVKVISYKAGINKSNTFTIVVEENLRAERRTGNLTIKTNEGDVTLKVTQQGSPNPAKLTLTPSELNVDANQHEYKVTLNCNREFRIIGRDQLDWAIVSGFNVGMHQSNTLSIYFKTNPGPQRTGNLTIKTTVGNVTLKVTQQRSTNPAKLTLTPSELNVDANRHEYKVTLSCEKAFWIINYNYFGWVKIISYKAGINKSNTFTIVVEENLRAERRTGNLTIKTSEGDVTLKVTQQGATEQPDTERPKPQGFVDGYPKAISPTAIEVKWNPATDNVTKPENMRYQVSCTILKKTMKDCPVLTGETKYTITDLPYSDLTYDITVKVWDAAGNYSFYDVKQVKPLKEEPKPTVQVSSVTLNLPKVTINGDRESFKLKAAVLPANATDPALQWSSSNESVATVEAVSLSSMLKSGTVEGSAVTVRIHKKGKTVITAQAMDGSGKSASCQVEVLSTVGNETIDGLRIYAADGALHLTLPKAETVHLYHVDGAMVKTLALPAGDHIEPLPAGVYMVRVGERVTKVMVK